MNQIIPIEDYENLSIFSNEFVFDENGTIIDLDVKVNSVGKYTILDNKKINHRKNILLLGDIISDANMVKNIDYETLISIGFLNKPKDLEKDVENFFTKYDVVIANDGSMEEVNRILKEIIQE